MARFAAPLLASLLPAIAGCIVYDPSLVPTDARRDAPTGPCDPRRAPERPTMEDLPDGPDVAFAMRNSFLDQGAEWSDIGLDLDGFCTTSTSMVSECMTREADGNDGIDNVFGDELYPLVEAVTPGLEEHARMSQEEGRGQPVIYVRGWNGTPNDPLVDVAIMSAVFTTGAPGPSDDEPPAVTIRSPTDYELATGDPVPLPDWDGQDWVWVSSDGFFEEDFEQPNVRDEAAYVVDGQIVVRLPNRVDVILPTEESSVLVRLSGATAIATLSSDGMSLTQVVVGGRWSNIDLLATAENVGICRGSPEYGVLETRLASISDVRTTAPMPPDSTLPCNAISLGVTFTGTRLRIAGITPGLPLSNICLGTDAGVPDDAGPTDAGGPMDAGVDAGVDAGEPDAGEPDAGVDGG